MNQFAEFNVQIAGVGGKNKEIRIGLGYSISNLGLILGSR